MIFIQRPSKTLSIGNLSVSSQLSLLFSFILQVISLCNNLIFTGKKYKNKLKPNTKIFSHETLEENEASAKKAFVHFSLLLLFLRQLEIGFKIYFSSSELVKKQYYVRCRFNIHPRLTTEKK